MSLAHLQTHFFSGKKCTPIIQFVQIQDHENLGQRFALWSKACIDERRMSGLSFSTIQLTQHHYHPWQNVLAGGLLIGAALLSWLPFVQRRSPRRTENGVNDVN